MDTQELKRIMEENCDQLASLLEDCQDKQTEMVLLAKVMGPIFRDYQRMQEQIFSESDSQQDQ